MAWDQVCDFEENDLSDWNGTQDAEAKLAASGAAAIDGSYGMEIDTGGTVAGAYGWLAGPTNETTIAIEFAFDPNSLTMDNGDFFALVQANGSGARAVSFAVIFYKTGGVYYIGGYVNNDASGTQYLTYIPIADALVRVYVLWVASSAPGANDGHYRLFLDSIQRTLVSGIDNDGYDVDTIFGGMLVGDTSVSGKFYMDTYRWNNEAPSISTPDVARVVPRVDPTTTRIREIVASPVTMTAQVDPGTTRIREIVANVARAIGQVAVGTSWVSKAVRALFRSYTYFAPEHMEIEDSKGVATAPFRSYELTADKRETDA